MRILFLTGIWPPDVGGPATHGPEFARFLVDRGHEVVVVTMGDGEPAVRPCEIVVVSRSSPFPVRYGKLTAIAARRAQQADVIYATATYAAASFASSLSRTPLAVKLVSDPAYERARRYALAGAPSKSSSARARPGPRPSSRPARRPSAARGRSSSRARTSPQSRASGASTGPESRCCRTRPLTSRSSPYLRSRERSRSSAALPARKHWTSGSRRSAASRRPASS